jgi:hypothetical protein
MLQSEVRLDGKATSIALLVVLRVRADGQVSGQAQPSEKGIEGSRHTVLRLVAEDPDHRYRRLLRARHHRPCRRSPSPGMNSRLV